MLYILLIILICVIASRKFRNIIRQFVDWLLAVAPALFKFAIVCIIFGILIFGVMAGWQLLKPKLWPWRDIASLAVTLIVFAAIAAVIMLINKFCQKKFGEKNVERVYDLIGIVVKELVILLGYFLLVVCFYPLLSKVLSDSVIVYIFLTLFVVYLLLRYLAMPKLPQKNRNLIRFILESILKELFILIMYSLVVMSFFITIPNFIYYYFILFTGYVLFKYLVIPKLRKGRTNNKIKNGSPK